MGSERVAPIRSEDRHFDGIQQGIRDLLKKTEVGPEDLTKYNKELISVPCYNGKIKTCKPCGGKNHVENDDGDQKDFIAWLLDRFSILETIDARSESVCHRNGGQKTKDWNRRASYG